MVIVFVFGEHCADFLRVEGHVEVVVGSNVPWRIELVLVFGADFDFEVFHVINACEDH